MRNVLYIAAAVPYDTVGHGGGQTLNYYIKTMAKQDKVKVRIISFCTAEVMDKLDFEQYDIESDIIVRTNDIKNACGNLLSINSKFNPWHKNGNIMTWYAKHLLIEKLKCLKKGGYVPDVIIMEWTQIVLLTGEIKKVYPSVPVVASEHDVTFLGKCRISALETNRVKKIYRVIQANNIRRREINALKLCNLVYTHNRKDDELLKQEGIGEDLRRTLVPYFHKSKSERTPHNNDILFYGNMRRQENHQTAVWFIRNVMPLIKDLPCRFVIIGGNPLDELKNMASPKVLVTGFVKEIDRYFAEALCFAAPLVMGAGIKIKVMEALYTGIPVITNEIGIEGIPAEDGKDYLSASGPEEYAQYIRQLYRGDIDEKNLHGREFMEETFSYEDSFRDYFKNLMDMTTD